MRGYIKGFMYKGLQRKTVVEVELDDNQCEQLEKLQGKELNVDFKIYREKRSLNANSYAWYLITQLAEYMDIPSIELYRRYIRDVGVYRDTDIDEKAENTIKTVWEKMGLGWFTERVDLAEKDGFVKVRLYYGSSVYNTKQMSRLIDNIVQDCQAVGIETMTPEEIAKMTSLWVGSDNG